MLEIANILFYVLLLHVGAMPDDTVGEGNVETGKGNENRKSNLSHTSVSL